MIHRSTRGCNGPHPHFARLRPMSRWVVKPMAERLPRAAVGLVVCLLLACGGETVPQSQPSPAGSAPSVGESPATGSYSLREGVKAKPDTLGPGAAGVCVGQDSEIVAVTLEIDVPSPRCVVIRGSQRLRVTNHFEKTALAKLGPLEMVIPTGASVTVRETFDSYMEPGGHTLKTDVYGGGGVELRFEGTSSG
jgi:hypothetical protein